MKSLKGSRKKIIKCSMFGARRSTVTGHCMTHSTPLRLYLKSTTWFSPLEHLWHQRELHGQFDSCILCWIGYTARQLHQRKVEERLNSIEQAMTTVHNLEVEQVQAITKGIGVSYPACAATATTTLVVGYALGFRGGRRYTLNRIRKQQQKPLALSKLNVTKLSRFSQVFQRAIVRPSRATDPLQANCDTKQDTKQELTLNALEAVGVVEAPKPVIK
nr:uncharacterized protein LOC112277200 isoform X5 [Physcomitrium patens]|eukprot:XP_024365171.1 uncharacterized protein LOC112277200 isoform X5 [Physcomitrella patens]